MNEILIRPWQKQDAQELAAIANNRHVWNNLRNDIPSPYTVTDALQWISQASEEKPVKNFAIQYQGRVAGSIGCVPKEDVYYKNMEIGYFIGQHFWGKGIATAAVQQLLEYIAVHFDVTRLEAFIYDHNKASMRVLKKNGFYLEGIRCKSVVKNNILMDEYVWVKITS